MNLFKRDPHFNRNCVLNMAIRSDPDISSVESKGDAAANRIARALEEDVAFGRLRPGQKLPEEELSERFSASRHQVREALARLLRIGVLTKERHKGVTVRRFTAEEVHQIYDVREMLQRQAVMRIPLPVPKSVIESLEVIHAKYERALTRGDFRSIHEANDEFHRAFFRLCGNKFLSELVMQFMDLSYAIRANAFAPEHLAAARNEHLVMIRLLGTRDAWALSQLCVDHIQYSKEQYLALLKLQEPEFTFGGDGEVRSQEY